MQIDDTDRRILRHLLADPALPNAQLAERAGVTAATCWRRLEKLQEAGVIAPPVAALNWRALGYEVEVSLRFNLDKTEPRAFDEFMEEARKIPEVIAIETFLGSVDLRLNVIARDMQHYQELYRRRILSLPHIVDIEALMLIATIKNESALPI
ncbi:Lrp/AsnC family transcriptional regulator [Pseudorhodobacter sp.]|uniref:Lrp/AsnC family transcriptional regulator n=1 Tax=Pseudorhodobacter sp. TaxID=1934400 RepID=UPI002647946F|nr:Lrp/AsnC family transcriptional regulator [Pseudorhodobacter sp.]MDN5787304.1 Lrp/AsnC family transcriptional regulator [Pseudorhodobacter sp.]